MFDCGLCLIKYLNIYQTYSDCINIGIRKFEFVLKNEFFEQKSNQTSLAVLLTSVILR